MSNSRVPARITMLFEIQHRYTGTVLFALECKSLKLCVEAAVKGGANLYGANLYGAYLGGANLGNAKNAERTIAYTRILPEGQIIGYKKGSKGEIIKLSIPADAKRSHAFGRKCRCEFADVLEISNGEKSALNGTHDKKIEYKVGERVTADKWDKNWQEECSHGIHFFITKIEAEDWE